MVKQVQKKQRQSELTGLAWRALATSVAVAPGVQVLLLTLNGEAPMYKEYVSTCQQNSDAYIIMSMSLTMLFSDHGRGERARSHGGGPAAAESRADTAHAMTAPGGRRAAGGGPPYAGADSAPEPTANARLTPHFVPRFGRRVCVRESPLAIAIIDHRS